LDLLKIYPTHKEILEKTLSTSTVPKEIDASQFQAMFGHIFTPHLLKFSDIDLPSQPSHNLALHLKFWVHNRKVKRVLVDGSEGINIYSLNLIKILELSDDNIEKGK
jgi:hypothetical protein